MSYPRYTPDEIRWEDREEEKCGGGSCIGFILIIVILLLAIAGLIVWLVLVYRRGNDDDRRIELSDANVEVTSNTSITATWTKTSSTEDVGILYASLEPIELNSHGVPSSTSQLFKSDESTGGTTRATLSKLSAGLKYYTMLVITNPHTSNFAVYNQLVYMSANQPRTDELFQIQNILQVGKVVLKENAQNEFSIVEFSQDISDSDDGWVVNSSGQIQSASEVTRCLVLEGDKVVAKECTEVASDDNSKWTYNHNGFANRWCISTTVNDSPKCLTLNGINPTSRTASLSAVENTDVGDAWVNVFDDFVTI